MVAFWCARGPYADTDKWELTVVKKNLHGILIAVILIFIFAPPGFSEGAVEKPKGKGKKTKLNVLNERILQLEEKLLKIEHEEKTRKLLESAEEEAANEEENEEDVLAAAGQDYTLPKPGTIDLNYGLSYTGSTYDSLVDSSRIEHNANHSITNSLSIQYPLKENLTYTASLNFKSAMNTQSNATQKDVTDIGDTTLGIQWQPTKSVGGGLSKIVNFSLSCPTGRSPYKIDPAKDLSTGSGGYSIGIGYNLSMPIDPVFLYGGVNYSYPFPITGLHYHQYQTDGESGVYLKRVTPGHSFGYSMGFGYSLSYSFSVSLGYSYSYATKAKYDWVGRDDYSTADGMSSNLTLGTNWNITPKRKLSVRLGIGLSNNSPDFTLSSSVPFKIDL